MSGTNKAALTPLTPLIKSGDMFTFDKQKIHRLTVKDDVKDSEIKYESCINTFINEYPVIYNWTIYTTLVVLMCTFGGYIYHFIEYKNENDLIYEKSLYYNDIIGLFSVPDGDEYKIINITAQNSQIYIQRIDKLINGLNDIPLEYRQNRWKLLNSIFFAFTTASTIGYGFTAPATDLGKLFTILYSLPAVSLFGIALFAIGNSILLKFDVKWKKHHLLLWGELFKSVDYEGRRTFIVLLLLLTLISISGIALNMFEGNHWTFLDSIYFNWITITTIGFGDLQPTIIDNNTIVVITGLMIVWLGLCLTAVLIGSMQDYVRKMLKLQKKNKLNMNNNTNNTNNNSISNTNSMPNKSSYTPLSRRSRGSSF